MGFDVVINLKRVSYHSQGTFGVLLKDGIPLCVTLEDPNNSNKQGVSCIPTGTYEVSKHNGYKYQNVWIVENVPNREAILIHNGNTIKDTQGCILVGSLFGYLWDLPAIIDSQKALNKLRKTLPDNFILTIYD